MTDNEELPVTETESKNEEILNNIPKQENTKEFFITETKEEPIIDVPKEENSEEPKIEKNNLEHVNDKPEIDIIQIKKENDTLKDSLKDYNILKKEYEEFKINLEEYKKIKEQLENRLKNYDQIQQENEKLKKELENKSKDCEQLKEDNHNLEKQLLKEDDRLKYIVDRLKSKVTRKQEKINDLLNKRKNDLKTISKEITIYSENDLLNTKEKIKEEFFSEMVHYIKNEIAELGKKSMKRKQKIEKYKSIELSNNKLIKRLYNKNQMVFELEMRHKFIQNEMDLLKKRIEENKENMNESSEEEEEENIENVIERFIEENLEKLNKNAYSVKADTVYNRYLTWIKNLDNPEKLSMGRNKFYNLLSTAEVEMKKHKTKGMKYVINYRLRK